MPRFLVFLAFLLPALAPAAARKIPAPESSRMECIPSKEDLSSFHCFSGSSRVTCQDTNDECPQWARKGECAKNPQYMRLECRKSCNSCIDVHHQQTLQIAPEEELREAVLHKLLETQQYVERKARESVSHLDQCVNKHELCAQRSVLGHCTGSDAKFMRENCAAACQTC